MKKNNTAFMTELQKAINDEASAIAFYGAILDALDESSEATPIVRSIRADEERHLKGLTGLYRARSGRQPVPETHSLPFTSLRQAFQMAIKGELAAQALYNDMYLIAPSPEARDFLYHTRNDEAMHSQAFMFLLQELSNQNAPDEWYYDLYQQDFRASGVNRETEIPVPAATPDVMPMAAAVPSDVKAVTEPQVRYVGLNETGSVCPVPPPALSRIPGEE